MSHDGRSYDITDDAVSSNVCIGADVERRVRGLASKIAAAQNADNKIRALIWHKYISGRYSQCAHTPSFTAHSIHTSTSKPRDSAASDFSRPGLYLFCVAMVTARLSGSALLFLIGTFFLLSEGQYIRGHWEKTWRAASTGKRGMNIGIAFSGKNTVRGALRDSARVYRRLRGARYVSIGGGNYRGRWSVRTLQDINRAITRGQFRRYRGIVYDVEEGDAGLSRHFAHSFRLARLHRLRVIVAVSHTAPYGMDDTVTVMRHFLSDPNIDVLSPMMYASGTINYCRTSNSLSTSFWKVPWSYFRHSRAIVVPSLLHPHDYGRAQRFLRRHGVTTQGYIAWCP
eukprot:IDg3t1